MELYLKSDGCLSETVPLPVEAVIRCRVVSGGPKCVSTVSGRRKKKARRTRVVLDPRFRTLICASTAL